MGGAFCFMGCTSPAQLQEGQPGWSSLLCSHVLLPLPLPRVCRWRDCRISLCSSRSQRWTNPSPQKVHFFVKPVQLPALPCIPVLAGPALRQEQLQPPVLLGATWNLLLGIMVSCCVLTHFMLQDLASKPLYTCKIVFARFTCLCVSLLDKNRLQSSKMQEFH